MGRHRSDPAASLAAARDRMISRDLIGRGIADRRVLDAMRDVPREAFVPPTERHRAYADRPLPIGAGQTISQPYIVALMLELAELDERDSLLEVGAGCGYAAAVASRLCATVVGIERVPALADAAADRLELLGVRGARIVTGDGSLGWADGAPYDAIVVSAGAPEVPTALLGQLAEGGRLVAPVGPGTSQRLVRVRRTPAGFTRETLGAVTFVPLIGDQGWAPG